MGVFFELISFLAFIVGVEYESVVIEAFEENTTSGRDAIVAASCKNCGIGFWGNVELCVSFEPDLELLKGVLMHLALIKT